MNTYRSRATADESEALSRLVCRRCHKETPGPILAQYGALCSGCYGRYCEEGFAPAPMGPLEHADKVAILRRMRTLFRQQGQQDPKAWAHALKTREESGERLSLVQKQMWRSALGVHA